MNNKKKYLISQTGNSVSSPAKNHKWIIIYTLLQPLIQSIFLILIMVTIKIKHLNTQRIHNSYNILHKNHIRNGIWHHRGDANRYKDVVQTGETRPNCKVQPIRKNQKKKCKMSTISVLMADLHIHCAYKSKANEQINTNLNLKKRIKEKTEDQKRKREKNIYIV